MFSSVLLIRSSASVSLPGYELKSVLISDMGARSSSFWVVTSALRELIAASISGVLSAFAQVALAYLALASSIASSACLNLQWAHLVKRWLLFLVAQKFAISLRVKQHSFRSPS